MSKRTLEEVAEKLNRASIMTAENLSTWLFPDNVDRQPIFKYASISIWNVANVQHFCVVKAMKEGKSLLWLKVIDRFCGSSKGCLCSHMWIIAIDTKAWTPE